MTLRLQSPAFKDGDPVPRQHSCEDADISPALSWSGLPDNCRSLALVCEDPDAPGGIWYHWAIFDIPAGTHDLAEGLPAKDRIGVMRQAVNSFHRIGYGGPCPPPGHGRHHYRFRLFALPAEALNVPTKPSCAMVEAAAKKLAIAEALLVGTYQR